MLISGSMLVSWGSKFFLPDDMQETFPSFE